MQSKPKMTSKPIILASTSEIRAQLLRNAGLEFAVMAADIVEDDVKMSIQATTDSADELAHQLAAAKALSISRKTPDQLVIGCDQVLECDGRVFNKPIDVNDARKTLMALRGKEHSLHTAIAVALDGRVIWHDLETPRLQMRDFSDEFLGDYLDRSGETVTWSAGGYLLENLGIQLFSDIKGDYFAILGLPLLPLLEFLRLHASLKR
jgi:septum formation protein